MAVKTVYYQQKPYDIHYEILHPECKGDRVFLHGWGSNKEVMKTAFSRCFSSSRHIYIDMPGFGKSPNETILTTHDYAAILELFFDAAGINKEIIFGHSFGGKVATLLKPQHLVLLSSAGILAPKALKVRIKIKFFKALRKMGLGGFWRLFATKDASGMSRVMYETLKNVVDEDFSSLFASFNGKCDIFWGRSDTATPLFCGERLASLIQGSSWHPMEGDHYFFLRQGVMIEILMNKGCA